MRDIEKLLDNGNVSFLGKGIGVKHNDLDKSASEMTTFYVCDMGYNEAEEKAKVYMNLSEFVRYFGESFAEYAYLFDPKIGLWFVTRPWTIHSAQDMRNTPNLINGLKRE